MAHPHPHPHPPRRPDRPPRHVSQPDRYQFDSYPADETGWIVDSPDEARLRLDPRMAVAHLWRPEPFCLHCLMLAARDMWNWMHYDQLPPDPEPQPDEPD